MIFFSLRFMFNLGTLFVCGGRPVLQNGFTALMWAAENGHTDCVGLLLAAGANREAKSNVRRRSFFHLRLQNEFLVSALYL